MKNFYPLALILAVAMSVLGTSQSLGQPCVPPHITYSIAKNPVTSKLEVSIASDKAYIPAIVGQSVVLGITFPTGYSWAGGAASFLNLNGSIGNGNWTVLGLTIAPSCSPTKDYVLFNLSSVWTTSFAAGESKVVLSFDLPQVPAPCNGSVFVLENSDPFAVSGGCNGTLSTSNYIAIFPGENQICDNYAGNTNNVGIACNLSAPLPIELVDFVVTAKGSTGVLNWTTVSERNSAGFESQSSTDGTTWEKIGWTAGKGDSDKRNAYQSVDLQPAKGTNYYRLKLVDLDGSFEYSEVRSLHFANTSGRATLYPNPSSGALTVEMPLGSFGDFAVQVLDTKGRVVLDQTIRQSSSSKLQLDLGFLPPAAYTLRVSSAEMIDHLPVVLVKP